MNPPAGTTRFRSGLATTLVLVALAALSGACSSPRLVRGITSRNDELKFLYYEGGTTGVIKCKLAADGALSECRPMQIALED